MYPCMSKPHSQLQAPDRAAWHELERSVETVQAGVTAVLGYDHESLERTAVLERLVRITALQRQMIKAMKEHYLGA